METQVNLNSFDAAAHAALAAGCPRDQVLNFHRAGLVLQPRQLQASAAARTCDAPDGPAAIGYGGARGGGKSFWMIAQMGADDCQRAPGLKCLLLRKVGKSNTEHLEDLRLRVFHRLAHEFASHRGVLRFANGSRIVTGHYKCESDIDAYLGLEYDVIGIEEATTLSRRKHEDIRTCLRSSRPGWRPRLYETTNPGGAGHAWFKSMFITPFRNGAETDTRFIPATTLDNCFTHPDYRKTLDRLSGWQKRAWRDGDWDVAAGQFFTAFRRDFHVLDDIDDLLAREWFAAMDYGHIHHTVILLGFRDGEGITYVVDEHAASRWVPERHAAAFRAMLKRHTFRQCGKYHQTIRPLELGDLDRIAAGQDVFCRRGDAPSIADQYRAHGIKLIGADMDRIQGWAEILNRLGDPDAGIPPRLFIHRRCRLLIETLPTLQHDPNSTEDVKKANMDDSGEGGDDAADALRYLIHSRKYTIRAVKLRGF